VSGHFIGAIGPEHQQRGPRLAPVAVGAGEDIQPAKRQFIGPLQIVQDQNDWAPGQRVVAPRGGPTEAEEGASAMANASKAWVIRGKKLRPRVAHRNSFGLADGADAQKIGKGREIGGRMAPWRPINRSVMARPPSRRRQPGC
jgi:hypothetical protein